MSTLTFYNKRRKSIRVIQHDEFIVLAKKYERVYFDTPNEYMISMRFVIDELRFHKQECSFIELSDNGEFICRHFVRDTYIAPFVSDEPDRSKCPCIRLPLVASKPILDWERIISDSFWSTKRGKMKEYLKIKP